MEKNAAAMTAVMSALVFGLMGCPKEGGKPKPPVKPVSKPAKPASKPTSAKPAGAPAHYFIKKEDINPDPKFVPGDYPMPDATAAKATFKAAAMAVTKAAGAKAMVAQPKGELTFGIAKNEKKRVFGYFREYAAVVKTGANGPEQVDVVIDLNSLDTAVVGRDNRIKKLVFEAMKPELGFAKLTLNKLDMGAKTWADAAKEEITITGKGTLTANKVTKPIMAKMTVKKEGDAYTVEAADPILIKLSDFGYDSRIYALIKACNHKSIGNVVDLGFNLKLK